MRIIFTWKEIIVMDKKNEIARFPATCNVRHELNGQRKPNQVIYTVNKYSKPYYPRQFPSGVWEITAIEWPEKDSDRYEKYGPVIIKTNATREVFLWYLDINGNYSSISSKTQTDTGYYIHHTHKYLTTHGCIRGGDTEDQMIALSKLVEPSLNHHSRVFLEVL